MLNHCVRWTLLFATALCLLAPSQQAEGGEFLKRLFGRNCRKVCVPCPDPCVRSVCYGVSPKLEIDVCPTKHVATVQVYDGTEFVCAYKVFIGSDCQNQVFYIHIPCEVKEKVCKDGKCCDKDNPMMCDDMTVSVDVAAVAVPLPNLSHDTWIMDMVPGAKDTYKHADLSMGIAKPQSLSEHVGVRLNVEVGNSIIETFKAKTEDGKYYVLNQLSVKRPRVSVFDNFGIGYEVTEEQYRESKATDISDKIYRGGGGSNPPTTPPPTNPPPPPPADKAINFGHSDGTHWIWNYNVVEFK
jgi:hypothetical protein